MVRNFLAVSPKITEDRGVLVIRCYQTSFVEQLDKDPRIEHFAVRFTYILASQKYRLNQVESGRLEEQRQTNDDRRELGMYLRGAFLKTLVKRNF